MNEKLPDPSGKGIARRRLLRGTFAAPAVLTLASGSAIAQASSMRCLANQIAVPTFPTVTTTPDNYPRVQLASLTPNGNGDKKLATYYVVGDSVAGLKKSSLYTLTTGEWQVFDFKTNTDVGGAILTSEPSDSGNSATYNPTSGQYAVLRYDAYGNVAGVGVGPTGTSAVSESCWNSFAAVA